MVNAASIAGFVDLCAGIMALEIFFFLDPQSGAGTAPSAHAPPLDDSAVELWLPLAAVGTLLTSVTFIYRHLSRAPAPAAGAANRRLSGFVIFVLCVSVGVLEFFFFFFVRPGGGVDRGAQARALGMGALRALPTAATATFFWGVMLIIVTHVRAGGEGGGGAVAGDGHGAVPGPVRILTMIALGAAGGLVFLATIAFCIKY